MLCRLVLMQVLMPLILMIINEKKHKLQQLVDWVQLYLIRDNE